VNGDEFVILNDEINAPLSLWFLLRSLQGNRLTGKIPEVIGLMQALAIL